MHIAAFEWVGRFRSADPLRVLDIGGRDINGTCRPWFPSADYTVLDIAPGPGVQIVADAATWQPDQEYDLVLAAEVFEHTAVWPAICRTAFTAARSGGGFVVTCAGPGRYPHSGVDGGQVRKGEHYANVKPADLRNALNAAGWADVTVDVLGQDVRSFARRP